MTPVEQQFLDASRERADAELTEARDRADREARPGTAPGGWRSGWPPCSSSRWSRPSSPCAPSGRSSARPLLADANRLAALSTTVGELDLSLLLAAQGVRLADTPETQDGLRAAVDGHERALQVALLSPYAESGALGDDGRTLFFVGIGSDLLTWPVLSGEQPLVAAQLSAGWGNHRTLDASPVDAVIAAAGPGRDGPWLRLFDVDRGERLVLSGDEVGGDPFELAFTPDGRRLNLLVASPAGERSAWRLVRVDPVAGTRSETGFTGTLPFGTQLFADISDDGSTAIVWASPAADPPTLVDLDTGVQATLTSTRPGGVVLGYRALASGAAQMWDDGMVVLYDRAGQERQRLEAHQLDVHRGAVRDVVLGPDRTWGATVGDGASVALWVVDPTSGRWSRPLFLSGHGADVRTAEYDPARKRLFTLAPGDRVIVWDLRADVGTAAPSRSGADPARSLRAACEIAGRDLSRAEWSHYLPGRRWQPTCSDLR